VVERFCSISRNLERLAGRLDLSEHVSSLDLASASADAIAGYLRDRREEALRRLGEAMRSRPGDVTAGIDQCWHAARFRKPALLLVEEGFVSPGTSVSLVGEGAQDDQPEPRSGEVHDLVDDLMEQVILRGGQLALVHDGELDAHGRIALISRG
jgi:hypothetical protein